MNTEKRIAFACFIGAALGALLALQFTQYFWWAGILLGGVAGYLSYEFRTVLESLKTAWAEGCAEYQSGFSRIRQFLKQLREFLIATCKVIAVVASAILIGFSWVMPSIILGEALGNDYFQRYDLYHVLESALLMSLPLGSFIFAGFDVFSPGYRKSITEMLKFVPGCFGNTNVITVLIWWFPIGIIKLLKGIPFALNFIWSVIRRTFILIHSEMRLLCMSDAVIGALAGYFLGNPLIGGVIGAICGVLNYKLVSVRWLKLVQQ